MWFILKSLTWIKLSSNDTLLQSSSGESAGGGAGCLGDEDVGRGVGRAWLVARQLSSLYRHEVARAARTSTSGDALRCGWQTGRHARHQTSPSRLCQVRRHCCVYAQIAFSPYGAVNKYISFSLVVVVFFFCFSNVATPTRCHLAVGRRANWSFKNQHSLSGSLSLQMARDLMATTIHRIARDFFKEQSTSSHTNPPPNFFRNFCSSLERLWYIA